MRDGTYEKWLVSVSGAVLVYWVEDRQAHVLFRGAEGTRDQARRIVELHNRELPALLEARAWERQVGQCSGSGYAHAPHGACSGYSTDRT